MKGARTFIVNYVRKSSHTIARRERAMLFGITGTDFTKMYLRRTLKMKNSVLQEKALEDISDLAVHQKLRDRKLERLIGKASEGSCPLALQQPASV